MKLREKTTATLLIAIFMISAMASVVPMSLAVSEYVLPKTFTITEGYAGWGGPLFDFVTGTHSDIKFGSGDWTLNWDPLVVDVGIVGEHVEFIIEVPQGMEDGTQENFWAEIDSDNDGTADWQFSFHSNLANHYLGSYWSFRENGDGWGPHVALPDWITTENIDWKNFKVRIDSDKLGSTFGFAMFVVEMGPEGFLYGNWGGCVIAPIQDEIDYFVILMKPPTKADLVPGKGKGIDDAPGLDKAPPNGNFGGRNRHNHGNEE